MCLKNTLKVPLSSATMNHKILHSLPSFNNPKWLRLKHDLDNNGLCLTVLWMVQSDPQYQCPWVISVRFIKRQAHWSLSFIWIYFCYWPLIKIHCLCMCQRASWTYPPQVFTSVHLFNKIVRSGFTINSPLFQNNWVKILHRENKVGWRFTKLICFF